MKTPIDVHVTLAIAGQCQRRGCSKVGVKRRWRQRNRPDRIIFLCDPCFRAMPAHKLRDAFRNLGAAER